MQEGLDLAGVLSFVDDAAERESAALRELAALRGRMKARVLVWFLLIGVAVGCVGYLVVREAQFAMTSNGGTAVSFPYLSGVGFLLPFLFFGEVGRRVAMALVRARMHAWVDEVARRFGVERAVLSETTDLLEDLDAAPV